MTISDNSTQTQSESSQVQYSNTYPPKFSSGTKYSIHIDYLQYNTPHVPPDALLSEEIKPIQFYKRGFRSTNGTRYYIGNPNSDRWNVIQSGKAMANLRAEIDELEHLQILLDTDCRISRLDLAMDLVRDRDSPVFITVGTLTQWVSEGKVKSKHMDETPKIIGSVEPDRI
ncbi:MAG: hypothetical protein AAFN66_05395, partial [Pseudomonadota bacterium]